MKKGLIILVIVVVLLVIYLVGFYNSLVTLNESVDNQWAQVETQYQRRFDLIPNLVSSVKGFFTQEQAIFDKITQARAAYAGAQGVNAKVQAAVGLEGALARLLAIMESNPEIKSDATVQTLMAELEGTENRVSVERMRFNDLVKSYNVKVKTFPGRFIASWFGFAEKAFFEAVGGAEVVPKVDLNLE